MIHSRADQQPERDGDRPTVQLSRASCPFCHGPIAAGEPLAGCGGCLTWIHDECLAEHAACPACGDPTRLLRTSAPPLVPRPQRPRAIRPDLSWTNLPEAPKRPCAWCAREFQPARNAEHPFCTRCVNRTLVVGPLLVFAALLVAYALQVGL